MNYNHDTVFLPQENDLIFKMVENGNLTEPNYGDTPYPDDGAQWLDAPTSNQVLGVEETQETVTMPSGMIPTGTGGKSSSVQRRNVWDKR